MQLGIEVLLENDSLQRQLRGRRVALLGHPASVDKKCNHTLSQLIGKGRINVACGFGPQHGMMGDKQYNMEESPTYVDPEYGIPIFSLYGEHRKPTDSMMSECDVVLVDLQDVGCRIYTYVATLVYMIEAAARHNKAVWVLDRPNPVGRVIDGSYLLPEWKSFVGEVETVIQHGLTLGELGAWYIDQQKLDLEYQVIKMKGYEPDKAPGFGWPEKELPWVNPSPQLPNLKSCRVYNGSVLLESTYFSEGRGTTVPLEVLGAPGLDIAGAIKVFNKNFSEWGSSVLMRPFYFTPWFDKHTGKLCAGVQFHLDHPGYDHASFRPYRFMAGFLKSIRLNEPERPFWRDFHYEYETEKSPVAMLSGCEFLKQWIDDPAADQEDLNKFLDPQCRRWREERQSFLIY